jgi:hypothetical protein
MLDARDHKGNLASAVPCGDHSAYAEIAPLDLGEIARPRALHRELKGCFICGITSLSTASATSQMNRSPLLCLTVPSTHWDAAQTAASEAREGSPRRVPAEVASLAISRSR